MEKIKELLHSEFSIKNAIISKLYGYDNINYEVRADNKRYVFKQYNEEPGFRELLIAESKILEILSTQIPGRFPNPVKALNGEYIIQHNDDGKVLIYRLLHYLDGDLMAKVEHTHEMFGTLGQLLAKMDLVLLEIRDIAIEARRYEWDIVQIDLTRNLTKYITNPSDRKLVDYFYQQYNQIVRPLVPELRKSIIHGDANDLNLIVNSNMVTGIIDFGDLMYSLLINEIAIAISYALFGKEDPLLWAVPIVRSYCTILPIEEKEIDILYYLIAARLCITVIKAAHSKTLYPDDEYYVVSEKPAWDLLRKWITINPVKAANEFRKAAGFCNILDDSTDCDLEKRQRYLSKALSISYSKPIKMEKAAFQYMYDNLGNTYLDARNNIPHVGHCHPKVVEAGQKMMNRLNTNTRYLYDVLNDYSERLLEKFPASLNKVFYVNSGSAASDLAIRLALTHTMNNNIVVMEQGYHGNTRMGIDISHYKYDGKGGTGRPDHIILAHLPDIHSRSDIKNEDSVGIHYADELIKILDKKKGTVAAFISEPIVGGAGQVPLPSGYLNLLYPYIRDQGGVCISDEVQTGFGRLGDYFWGYEMFDVVPDIIILGKPIANGHPMAAVVTTSEVAQSFDNGMEFFSSFGGNPVSCAIAMAVLDVMDEEDLQKNARDIGNYLIEKLNQLKKKYPSVGDIRGSGLFIGLEFIKDRATREPATALTESLMNELRNRHILVDIDGPFENVLKIKPPLCFSKENADRLVNEISDILD